MVWLTNERTLWIGLGCGLLILRKNQLVSFDCSDNCGAIDLKIDGSVLEKKSSYVWTVIIDYVGVWFLHCLTC